MARRPDDTADGRAREGRCGAALRPTRVRLSGWVGVIAAVQAAALLATSMRYGYHRDELYFIVAGSHPAFGYPDQPPLVPLLCWAMNALAPGSLLLLRTPSTLAAAATTILAALIAREVGGGPRAQIIAAACTATSGFALAVAHLVTTTTSDLLSTTVLGWLAIRAIVRGSGASVLAAGVVVGLGVEAKPQVGLVAAVMVASLIVVGPRSPIRSWWAAGGAMCAVVLAAPYVIWQQQHGWPQADRGRPHRRHSGGWAGRLFPVPVCDGQPAPRAGLDRRAARPVSARRMAPAALRPDHLRGDGRSVLRRQRPRVLPRKPLPRPSRSRRATHGRMDEARPEAHVAPGHGDRAQRGDQRCHRSAAAPRARPAGERRDGAQPRPGRDGRLASLRPDRVDRMAADSRRRTPANGDLHAQLRRGGGDRPPPIDTPTTARLQRPQRIQRMGRCHRPPIPARCFSASKTRQKRHPTSSNVERSPPSTIASASTTTSRVYLSCSAEPPGRGRSSGHT